MRANDCVQRLAEFLEMLRAETFAGREDRTIRLTFSAGVAEHSGASESPQELCRSARSAMLQAREAGMDRVLAAGWRAEPGGGPRHVEVVVVEDDDALADLLMHALATRGYRAHRFADGLSAAEALLGTPPRLTARVALLDVNLPGLNGLALLTRMSEEQVVRRTRVIVLSVRTAEVEMVKALELGAFDYVTKPFSLPVLMQKIRRGLES